MLPYNFVTDSFHTGVTAEALQVKIDRNQRFRCNAVTLIQNFRHKGSPPPIIFARLVRPYNFVANSFHTKKLCSRLSSTEVRFYTEIGRSVFLRPPLGDLGATYDDHLRLIGKRIVDFLSVLTELFSLGVTARRYERLSVQNQRICSNGVRLTQNFR